MARNSRAATSSGERNVEIKLAVCRWKVITGMTQQQLAGELGIPPSYLCDILNGRRPGFKYLPRITEITQKFAS